MRQRDGLCFHSLSHSLSLGGRVWIDSWHSSCEVSRVTAWAQQMPLTHPGPKSQALQWDCRFFPTENKLQRSTQVVSWLLFFLLAAKRSPVCGTFCFVFLYVFQEQPGCRCWCTMTGNKKELKDIIYTYRLHPFHSVLTFCWADVCVCVAQCENYVSHLD